MALRIGVLGVPAPGGGPWVSLWSHLVGLHGPAQVLDPAVAFGQGRAPEGPAALARDDLGAGRVSGVGWHPRVPVGAALRGSGCPRLRAVLGCPFGVSWVPLQGALGSLGACTGCLEHPRCPFRVPWVPVQGVLGALDASPWCPGVPWVLFQGAMGALGILGASPPYLGCPGCLRRVPWAVWVPLWGVLGASLGCPGCLFRMPLEP